MPPVWNRHVCRTKPEESIGPARDLRGSPQRLRPAQTQTPAAARPAIREPGRKPVNLQPVFATRGDLTVVGLAQPYRRSDAFDRLAVRRRFEPFIGRIPDRIGTHPLGINEVLDMAAGDRFYAPAVEVREFGGLPDGLFGPENPYCRVLEGGRFAIFPVPLAGGDVSAELRRACDFIYGTWVQESGAQLRSWYDFEYYGARFDPATLTGEVSIWVPVR